MGDTTANKKVVVLFYNYESLWEEDKVAGVFDDQEKLNNTIRYLQQFEEKLGDLSLNQEVYELNQPDESLEDMENW